MKRCVWLALPLLLTACPVPPVPVKPNELDATAKISFTATINAKRQAAPSFTCTGGAALGYPDPQTFSQVSGALVWNYRLEAAALNQASFLATNNVNISIGDPHNGAGNGTLASRVVSAGYTQWDFSAGETIAAGQATASAVADGWQVSTNAHCNIMLDSAFTEIGAALVSSSGGTKYWVMVVGHKN